MFRASLNSELGFVSETEASRLPREAGCVCGTPVRQGFSEVYIAGGRGTHTDSSANEAGLYAVRISLRTLSDVPAAFRFELLASENGTGLSQEP